MEDIKNLVIKVKYPSSEKKSLKNMSSSKMITEWNIKRLLIASAVGAPLLALVLFFMMRSTGQELEVTPSVVATEAVITKAKNAPLVKSKAVTKNTITRALLTLTIKDNKPVKLNLPLMLPANKSVPVYYFVEFANMKDRIIFHEWWLADKLINRKKISISNNDKWRTVSHQLVAFAAKNNWTVKVVDEKGQSLIEKHFDIGEQK